MDNFFIAIQPPETIKQTIAKRIKSLTTHQASWVHPDLYHLTVRFLGAISEDTARNAFANEPALHGIATPHSLSFFRRDGYPRVLYIHYHINEKSYHLTLARCRNRREGEHLQTVVNTTPIDIEDLSFTVSDLILLRSKHTDRGIHYIRYT